MKLLEKLIIITLIFCCNNFSVFAETKTFPTITDALNYSGDREAVTHLIITDSIAGSDYGEDSEWKEFRTLNIGYPVLSEITILTAQDIPGYFWMSDTSGGGLFSFWDGEYDYESTDRPLGIPIVYSANWLKHFSAPNTKSIPNWGFHSCKNLLSVSFESAEKIIGSPFGLTESLISVNAPLVRTVGNTAFAFSGIITLDFPILISVEFAAFIGCERLTSVSFGTGFTEPTTIKFENAVFGVDDDANLKPILTPNIELTLGEYVLPKPDTVFNIWQSTWQSTEDSPDIDYVWKKINWTVGIEEENNNNNGYIYYLENNLYRLKNVEQIELYNIMGRLIITFENVSIINLNNHNLVPGFYFLKYYTTDNKIRTKKIIRH